MKTIFVLMLAMSALVIGSARADDPKGYRINLSAARIGTTDVDAGEYRLLVHRDEPKVQLMDGRTGELTDFAAKVETVQSKFDNTEVLSRTADGVKQIVEIRIGGTKLRVDFQKAS